MLGDDYHTLANIEWRGRQPAVRLRTEIRETRITIGTAAESTRGAGSFFPLGIEHILTGYDHLLFLSR